MHAFPMMQRMGICYLADCDLRRDDCKQTHVAFARAELELPKLPECLQQLSLGVCGFPDAA